MQVEETEQQLQQILNNPDMVEAELCRRSLACFVRSFWSVIVEDELVWNWHIEYMCNEVQAVYERVFERKPKEYDLIINVPPGSSKSTVISQMAPAWGWTRDPFLRYLTASYNGQLSGKDASRTRDLVQSNKYRNLFRDPDDPEKPFIILRSDQNVKSYYMNTRNGDRFSTSVGSAVAMGMHAHIQTVDDPINPEKAAGEITRRGANDWFDNTLSTRKVDKSLTPLILVMQRLAPEDPTGHLLENRKKIKHIKLPGRIDEETRPKPESVVELYSEDGLLDESRLSADVLETQMSELGQHGYAGQILQEPVYPGGEMFKVHNINVVKSPPSKVVLKLRYWDKAGSYEQGKYTAGVLMGKMQNKRWIVLDVIRGRWGTDERERVILQTARLDGVEVPVFSEQEPGSGGKDSARATTTRLIEHGFRAFPDKVTGNKIYRADPFSVQCNFGDIYILKADWNRDFINELRVFPNGKYTDQTDAASGAFSWLNKCSTGTW